MSVVLGLAAAMAVAADASYASLSLANAPPLAQAPDEIPAEMTAPPSCDDVLRMIARGFGGHLHDMRLTRDRTWGLIWRGGMTINDFRGPHDSRVVCASGRGQPLVVDAGWTGIAARTR